MTKADLQEQNDALRKEIIRLREHRDKVEKLVDEALKAIIDITCTESTEHIETFCNHTGYNMPYEEITLQLPYGTEIGNIEDSNYEDVDFKVIIK